MSGTGARHDSALASSATLTRHSSRADTRDRSRVAGSRSRRRDCAEREDGVVLFRGHTFYREKDSRAKSNRRAPAWANVGSWLRRRSSVSSHCSWHPSCFARRCRTSGAD
jgi:hypothetical protein